jgi:endoglucanase
MTRLTFSVLSLAALFAGAGLFRSAAVPSAAQQVERLGRGMNVLCYDPIWQDPAKARFKPDYFHRIRDAGFQHVRLNLQAFSHMDGKNQLDPTWLSTLGALAREARDAGLMVILDEHDHQPCGEDLAACREKLLAFWEQVAPRFRNAPPSVLFEILNEPNGQLTADAWNTLLAEVLAVIRRSNPHRTVVIGPANYNHFRALDQLELPAADPDIIVTVHYYEPFNFTHQGANWTAPSRESDIGYSWGALTERAEVGQDFDGIAAWGEAHQRPILIGEFGAYEKGDMASRTAWTGAVARAAEARGFAWSYWQFESSFEAFDMQRDDWIAPIRDALIPR